MASRRQYLSQAELADFADIQIVDPTEADDRISQAEEIIDKYVGPQDQFISRRIPDILGLISAVASGQQFTLEQRHQSVFQQNFFTYCECEIIGGTGSGNGPSSRSIITSSTYPGVVTLAQALTLDATSFYRIYQLGKFPRQCDTYYDGLHTPNQFYKSIPEEIKRAVAAQVEYMIEQGDDFFRGNDVFINNEQIGDYKYDKARDGSGTGISQVIAPKAKWLLRGYINRKGVFVI